MWVAKETSKCMLLASFALTVQVALPGLLLLCIVSRLTGLHSIDLLGNQTWLENLSMVASIAVTGAAMGAVAAARE